MSKIIVAALLSAVALTACDRKFADPPARMSVNEFKTVSGIHCVEIIYTNQNVVVSCAQESVDKREYP